MKANLIRLFVIFSMVFGHFTFGTEVVVRSEEADMVDFQAFIAARIQAQSLAERLYEQSPRESENQELVSAFTDAQSLFFQVHKDKAFAAFERVLQLRTQSDWRPQQTQFFFVSALRAAELASQKNQRSEFLRIASLFKKQHPVNTKIFSPPLVKEFESVEVERRSMPVPPSWSGFEILSINGERHAIIPSKPLSLPIGVHRATLYSSAFKTQSKVVDTSELTNWTPEKISWLKGTCENPQFDDEIKDWETIAFFNAKCFHGSKLNLTATASTQPLRQRKEIPFEAAAPPAELSPWWKNKWLWMGLAGAGAAYLVYENNRNSSGSNPSGPIVYE